MAPQLQPISLRSAVLTLISSLLLIMIKNIIYMYVHDNYNANNISSIHLIIIIKNIAHNDKSLKNTISPISATGDVKRMIVHTSKLFVVAALDLSYDS